MEELAIAILPRIEDGIQDNEMWDVYLLNLKDDTIENVLFLMNFKGYGELDGEQMKTTTLRHFFNDVGPKQALLIEPIQTKLFDIANEYWVSFTFDGYMYDKRYVFVRGSIAEKISRPSPCSSAGG